MIQTSFFKEEEEEIFIDPNGLKPKKLEEVITDKKIPEDTYTIYPSGGFHPFYGVPNTFPLYQKKIWPYIKRIKYNNSISIKSRGRSRDKSQLNCDFKHGYPRLTFQLGFKEQNGTEACWDITIHRIIALAYIPNPEEKKNVMHRNDDKTNYLIKNLKWGTSHENNKGALYKRPDTMEDKYHNMILQGIIKG